MPAMQAMASGPLAEDSLGGQATRLAIDAIALVLPRLDGVARTDWLLYGPPHGADYLLALGGVALYSLLLVAAGLFDFHRRNL